MFGKLESPVSSWWFYIPLQSHPTTYWIYWCLVGNGWEWGLLGWWLISYCMLLWIIPSFPAFSTSKTMPVADTVLGHLRCTRSMYVRVPRPGRPLAWQPRRLEIQRCPKRARDVVVGKSWESPGWTPPSMVGGFHQWATQGIFGFWWKTRWTYDENMGW